VEIEPLYWDKYMVDMLLAGKKTQMCELLFHSSKEFQYRRARVGDIATLGVRYNVGDILRVIAGGKQIYIRIVCYKIKILKNLTYENLEKEGCKTIDSHERTLKRFKIIWNRQHGENESWEMCRNTPIAVYDIEACENPKEENEND